MTFIDDNLTNASQVLAVQATGAVGLLAAPVVGHFAAGRRRVGWLSGPS